MKNIVSVIEGERFHQEIFTMKERYKGYWDLHVMADYCWSLKRNTLSFSFKKIIKEIILASFEVKLYICGKFS